MTFQRLFDNYDTSTLMDELKQEEGCKLMMYNDSKGIPTIGWGHNLNEPISQEVADMILYDDINDTVAELITALSFTESLDKIRQSVFLDMCYNMGIGSLLEFHDMINYSRTGDWKNASNAGLNSEWAKTQVPNRAKILMQRLLTGVL